MAFARDGAVVRAFGLEQVPRFGETGGQALPWDDGVVGLGHVAACRECLHQRVVDVSRHTQRIVCGARMLLHPGGGRHARLASEP